MTILHRRGFLLGLGAALATPAIVKFSSLMPVRGIIHPTIFTSDDYSVAFTHPSTFKTLMTLSINGGPALPIKLPSGGTNSHIGHLPAGTAVNSLKIFAGDNGQLPADEFYSLRIIE